MGDTYSFKSEIWALGCLFWYILTKEYIFEPELIGTSIERDCNQLKLIEKYIGKIPEKIKLKCRKTYELFQDQNIKEKNNSKESTISYTLLEKTLKKNKSDFTDNQINNIVGFFLERPSSILLSVMLSFSGPALAPTTRAALRRELRTQKCSLPGNAGRCDGALNASRRYHSVWHV